MSTFSSGNDLYPMGLTCCEVTTGKLQFKHTFIVCKKLWKEVVTGFDRQQLHHLGCDWVMMDECFYIKKPTYLLIL